jgi:hypothetical protein
VKKEQGGLGFLYVLDMVFGGTLEDYKKDQG